MLDAEIANGPTPEDAAEIEEYWRELDRIAAREADRAALRAALLDALRDILARGDPAELAQVSDMMSCFLFEFCAGLPAVKGSMAEVRADALIWADMAATPELESYAMAILRQIEAREIGQRMARRLVAAAWQAMAAKDRVDFLAKVDPSGTFRGGK